MLEIRDVSLEVKNEKGSLNIINHINLSFEKGKMIVITGPNGGGKSTMARLIMGIEQPTAGQILLDGEDITNKNVTERAKLGIGYAFQQPPRMKGMTVRNLLSLAYGKPIPKAICCEYLKNVGLCSMDYMNREVDSSLSGGEMKRIEIATLFARKCKVAIFDEPEAGIDLWGFRKLTESFQKLHLNNDQTIIIISHQERILELADEIIVISDGIVQEHNSKEEILPKILSQTSSHCWKKRREFSYES